MGVEGKVKEKVDTSKAGVGIALPRKKKKHQQVQGRRGCGRVLSIHRTKEKDNASQPREGSGGDSCLQDMTKITFLLFQRNWLPR